MNYQNDDLRIKEIKELLPPVALLEKFPATENAANTVAHARKAIHKILKGNDDRLLVVIGPCSIHDPVAAKEYAARLLTLREELQDELEGKKTSMNKPGGFLRLQEKKRRYLLWKKGRANWGEYEELGCAGRKLERQKSSLSSTWPLG